jgi:hypothetical protein
MRVCQTGIMAIQITCPGCHKRFQVSDKFAGQKGPCPNCKTVIQIPKKEEEAVIHAPEEFGGKGKTGVPTFKPVARVDARFSPAVAGVIAAGVLVIFALAWFVGRAQDHNPSWMTLSFGAVFLAPPLVLAGYFFLRDDELEPFRGQSLWIRVGIVSLVYALIWGIVGFWIKDYLLGVTTFEESYQIVIAIAGMIALGAFAAHAGLDLDVWSAAFHYGLYLLATVLLRMTMGMYETYGIV